MRVTIGENTERAMKVLGIESYPFTYSELKSSYRSLIKIYHPDVAKGNKEEAEKKMKENWKRYDEEPSVLGVLRFVLEDIEY